MGTIWVARPNAISVAASTVKTLVQVYANNGAPMRIKEIGVSFNGVDATFEPIEIDLLYQSTAGTMTALTLVTQDYNITNSPTATASHTATVEPTAGYVLRSWYITPAGGTFVMQWPLGEEPASSPTGRIGLRAVTATGVSASILSYIAFEQ